MKKLLGKLYFRIIVCVVILAAVATPTSLYLIDKQKQAHAAEVSNLKTTFARQNTDSKIVEIAVQDKTYMISWDNGTDVGISVLFGGIWVTIYSQPKPVFESN